MTGVANGGSFRPRALFPYAIDPGETVGVAVSIRPKSLPALFEQGKHWRRSDGTWVRVKDMHPAHRANAARMLLRDAAEYAQMVSMAELTYSFAAPEEVLEQEDRERTADPVAWMRGTKLYRRLVKGLDPWHPRGSCVICDEKWQGTEPGEIHEVQKPGSAVVDPSYAQMVADPIARAATRVALETVLTVFEERKQRGGEYWSRALLHGDIGDMVTEAARRIGVTL